jgi:mono/diheme cytochrome c family protein
MSSKFAPRSVARVFVALLLGAIAFAASARSALAMPVFAQRYHLTCAACHTALPELNAFGNSFRNHGYRLPASVPRHGTTVVAFRYNFEYENDPVAGARRFSPGESDSILADEDIGNVNVYLHYGLGSQGAPSAPYLGFLSTYDAHVNELYRLGLFEVPLTQSPGQRLDSISEYGYFGTAVGHNDLALNAPRLGFETERTFGNAMLIGTLAFGEYKGAAYGGKPVFDGASTTAERPEFGLYGRLPIGDYVQLNAQVLDGSRNISLPGEAVYIDPYDRFGYGADFFAFKKTLNLTAQQWLGHDDDANGDHLGIDSSGGYVRLKYFITPHVFIATRLDNAANPFPTREFLQYVGALVTKHARVVLERRVNLLGGTPSFGGYLTVAAPWPIGL